MTWYSARNDQDSEKEPARHERWRNSIYTQKEEENALKITLCQSVAHATQHRTTNKYLPIGLTNSKVSGWRAVTVGWLMDKSSKLLI